MERESPKPASTPTGAVFLSYASQDAETAARVCNALRAAGIEVWFDQSELRGGDAWDQSIRKQIKTCALFVPLISQHTHERAEGYFRLEWKLAVDRCYLMSADKPFLVPVVIDDTPDDDERVPEKFREVQWTRLPRGETPPDFATRIGQLLSGESGHSLMMAQPHAMVSGRPSRSWRWLALLAVLAAAAAYLLVEKPWIAKPALPARQTASADTPVAFTPPPHSIAVLPFVNMSGDPSQEYFSDGLTEELLNSLAHINELQVAARTSSFSFQGAHPDIGTVAHKLNVASVLEGSVRRSGHTIRVTAQLNNGVTGFHLWSQTYDRDLGDVLKLQTEIATAVANSLKVTLLGDLGAKIELGGTRNPAALDAYLRASKTFRAYERQADLQAAIAGYSEAIRLDPGYARAFAYRSVALAAYARNYATGPAIREAYTKAHTDAHKAIALTPELAEAHYASAKVLEDSLEFTRAGQEYQRAAALAPGNALLLGDYGVFAAEMGQTEAGLAAAGHALVLDPLSSDAHSSLGAALMAAGRYPEAIAAFTDAKGLGGSGFASAWLSFAYIASGDFQSARTACERADDSNKPICFALVYEKLGRHAEARQTLAQLQAESGDASAVFYAMIYAQWGDTAHALDWLETAMRHRDPYLIRVRKNHNFDPLRNEPRFQAIERELKFPD
jgi:TolB-like protein/tetratricopeptide (TPR) repeat protein